MRHLLIALVLMVTGTAHSQAGTSAGDQILGEWRGTSLCTNLELAPACKDESVRYTFTKKAGLYHLAGEKLVGGSYELMGEMDFVYSASDATWSYPMDSPRCPACRWWYRVDSKGLVGGLVTGKGEAIRKVEVRRVSSSGR